jgi:hypothetical protein
MQYLVPVIADTSDLATGQEMTAIDAFNDRLIAQDRWVCAAGLDLAFTLAAEGSEHCNRKVEVRPVRPS